VDKMAVQQEHYIYSQILPTLHTHAHTHTHKHIHKHKHTHQEPNFTNLANPARVLVAQKKYLAMPTESRYRAFTCVCVKRGREVGSWQYINFLCSMCAEGMYCVVCVVVCVQCRVCRVLQRLGD
jgi:hypothetical protein